MVKPDLEDLMALLNSRHWVCENCDEPFPTKEEAEKHEEKCVVHGTSKIIFCTKCGIKCASAANFCSSCGTKLEKLDYASLDWGDDNYVESGDSNGGFYLFRWLFVIVLILLVTAILGGDNDDSEVAEEYRYTTISVSMINNDNARHPVHVYLDGDHVYGEWVEVGELVWPTICLDRCPDGDYTIAVDWGGDAEFECTYYVKISYEGDRETVTCNYE